MTDTQTPEAIKTPNGHCQRFKVGDSYFVSLNDHAAVVAERDQLKEKLTELEKYDG